MASLTRSVSMRPFFLRLLMRASLLSPEHLHAMLKAVCGCRLRCTETGVPRTERVSFVRKGTVNRVHRIETKSVLFVGS
jgi:hypothetical protein